MAPRTRTGCLTCRTRKLKCSEERPRCAQCVKAHRECVPSPTITFRHQQNPSLNGAEGGEGRLKSFYGYKETFGKGTVWVDVPTDLTFVHTSNPYDDEEDGLGCGGGYTSAGGGGGDAGLGEGDTSFMTDATGSHDVEKSLEYHLAHSAYPGYATLGLEALSAVASRDQYNYAPPPAPMSQHDQTSSEQLPTTSSQGNQTTANLDFILNPTSAAAAAMSPSTTSNIDPRLHAESPVPQSAVSGQGPSQSSEHVRTHSYSSSFGRPRLRSKGLLPRHRDRSTSIEEPEMTFLLRDYSERAGMWMDLFDLGLFFATAVPVLAVRCPLLLYSCAALSAKCLARVEGRKPVLGGQVTETRRSKMERWPGPLMNVEDWVHKAREYYDVAVSLLRQALSGASRPPTASLPENAAPSTISSARRFPLPTTDSDELVAGTAILSVYEFLDASGPEWSRHLDGAKSLFDIAKDRMVPLTLPSSPVSVAQQVTQRLAGYFDSSSESPRLGLSKGRKAIFWNFARQDMLSAFINNTSTRLDTSDLSMWRSAGLKLTPEGFVCPSNPLHPDYSRENAMQDDVISNALIWLLGKLVNYVASGDDLPQPIPTLGLGIRQKELLDYWEGLDAQLTAWYEGLPDTFHATAVQRSDSDLGIDEQWFPRPMCASSMQSYHFARIQLLHNKPHLTTATPFARTPLALGSASPGTSLAARHASYATILEQSREHAKQVVAIGLGRSDEGTRIHSVQPLWTAGLVLGISEEGEKAGAETEMWRRSILSQLRGIERDMGWASEYRVKSLLGLWGLPSDWGLDSPA